VTVDDQRPLQARCRLVKELDGILIRTESRALENCELISSSEVRIQCLDDLNDYNNPRSECALLKCALIYLGLTTTEEIAEYPTRCIQPYLNKFCQRGALELDAGLEVVSVSKLPAGSGMGGSSVLAGCILSAVARCIGVTLDEDKLIHAVLMIEQLLTTGGGWQDQIGGLISGLKLGTSEKGGALSIKVRHVYLDLRVQEELSKRLVLAFTGKPRLAKNILQNVLRRWSRRSSEIVDTVEKLVRGASDAVDSLVEGDFNRLGSCITSYWEQKKLMAGSQSGVEPDFVKSLLVLLKSTGNIIGGTLCGAGGEYL
jgi:fucokinase